MKLQLDTTNMVITFEDGITYGDLCTMLHTIIPGYYDNDITKKFKLNTNPIPDKNLIDIKIPISTDYSYKPELPWLDYKQGAVKLTDGKLDSNYSLYLKDGVFNIAINY